MNELLNREITLLELSNVLVDLDYSDVYDEMDEEQMLSDESFSVRNNNEELGVWFDVIEGTMVKVTKIEVL